VNVWFFDEDEIARAPMFEYFQRFGLVRMNVLENGEEETAAALTSTFAEGSTKTQWRDKGVHFYNQHEWALAEKCFTLADDKPLINKSKAQRMAQEASTMRDNPQSMNEKYCAAAAEFLECDMAKEAADCLYNAGENLLLAKLHKRMIRVRTATSFLIFLQ
jgi:hypothetical protein